MSDIFTNKNKKMIIKGAGKFMAKIPGCAELITLGSMTNMRLDIQLDMVDIEGGDTSAPIDTLLRKKVIDITAEDAKFDLNLVRLVLGSKLREGVDGRSYTIKHESVAVVDNLGTLTATLTSAVATGGGVPDVQVYNESTGGFVDADNFTATGTTVTFTGGAADGENVLIYYPVSNSNSKNADGFLWVLEEKHDVVGNEIDLRFGLFSTTGVAADEHVSVRLTSENKLLRKVTSNTGIPKDGFYVDVASGTIQFNAALEGLQVYVNYKRPEVVDVLDIGSKDFPLTVHVVHDGQFEQKDGSIQGYQTELYACRVKSNFTLDAARQTAATHSVTLTVIDPERSDERLGTIKRYQIDNIKGDNC